MQFLKVFLEHQERCIGCYNCVFACSLELFGVLSATRTAITIKPCSLGDQFIVNFCTKCENPSCLIACQSRALQQDEQGRVVLTKPSECNTCEDFECTTSCVSHALSIDPETQQPILCTQCGRCSDICPHEVITFKEATK